LRKPPFGTIVRPWAALALAAVCGCASVKARVDIKSEPSGAEVFDRAGTKLGETPLSVEGDKLSSVTDQGFATLELRKSGYESRTLVIDTSRGMADLSLKLRTLDEAYFRKATTKEFTPEINAIARELLGIQGLIIIAARDEAEERLRKFQDEYPLVAAGYVMRANLALMRGDRSQAQGYLLRAQELDPLDPVVTRMLRGLGLGARVPASSGTDAGGKP
jgi:tetratricopeptide (TPR) repeat protein